MALISRKANVTLAKAYQEDNTVGSGLIAGETLESGSACYIRASDRRVFKSGGAGMTLVTQEVAQVHGFNLKACAAGDPVTLFTNVDLAYSAQGAIANTVSRLWVSNVTAGRLDDTLPFAGLRSCAFVVGDGMTTETDGGTIFVTPVIH